MKNNVYKKYIVGGLTVFFVIAASIILFFILYKYQGVNDAFKDLIDILKPIIYGAALAYLLNPIYKRCEIFLEKVLIKRMRRVNRVIVLARFISTLVVLAITVLAMCSLYFIVPQVVQSLLGVASKMPGYLTDLGAWVRTLLEDNENAGPVVIELYNNVADYVENWIRTEMLPTLTGWVGLISAGIISIVSGIINIFIGIIVMVYLLNGKTKFAAQSKKIVYSIFKVPMGNAIIENLRFIHRVFGGFINGKILDSLIIGLICFAFMVIARMPYAVLISVIIGVTNVIPFFGPFIGAIPSAILILFESPVMCIYFCIFILILQQVDGNIIGPKILGGTTGLPSFWVLFSILLFGGLFGFLGMIVGVPVFALLYSVIAALVNRGLKKRDLSTVTEDYRGLHHIDEDNLEFVSQGEFVLPQAVVMGVKERMKEKEQQARQKEQEQAPTEDNF